MYLSFKHEPGWVKSIEEDKCMNKENLAYMPDKKTWITRKANDIKRAIKHQCTKTLGTAVQLRKEPRPKRNRNGSLVGAPEEVNGADVNAETAAPVDPDITSKR